MQSTHATGLDYLNSEIQNLKDNHLYQSLRTLNSAQGVEVVIDGKPVLNFSSNNYLGLATHPKLKQAAIEAIEKYGVGAGAVRTISGTLDLHQELETKLAAFKKTEATLVLQSGFTANQAAINSILSEGDVILTDELNHASIIDACRLVKNVPRHIFRHKDMNHLEEQLKQAKDYKRKLIVTDGVFSMDGDIAPLPEIVSLAETYNAIVMVDDAHASGVLGKHGSGTTSHFGLYGKVDIQVGTLSKAIGAMGGYVAGVQALRDVMINKARPFLFSTAHPPATAAACIAALDLLTNDPSLHEKLWANTHYFQGELKKLGFDIQSETPITPVIVGSSEKAQALSKGLLDRGIFAQAIVFPTVAKDKARIRLMVSAAQERHHLDKALEAISEVSKQLGIL